MKKLITLSFLLLMTSGAYAAKKSKIVSKTITLRSNNECKSMKKNLDNLSRSYSDIVFSGKCRGVKLVAKLRLKYLVTPTQRFTLYNPNYKEHGYKYLYPLSCGMITRSLEKFNGIDVTIKTKCVMRSPLVSVRDESYIVGKITIH